MFTGLGYTWESVFLKSPQVIPMPVLESIDYTTESERYTITRCVQVFVTP